jgi:hypothetical protein
MSALPPFPWRGAQLQKSTGTLPLIIITIIIIIIIITTTTTIIINYNLHVCIQKFPD